MEGFKKFLLRGNVLDLAVAVVIGAAFGQIVTSLVEGLITPLLGAIGGQPDFSAVGFTINNSRFQVGTFINAIVSFLILATVIYFLVVLPVNTLVERTRRQPPPDPTLRKCPECLSDIPTAARRCSFCTSQVDPMVRAAEKA